MTVSISNSNAVSFDLDHSTEVGSDFKFKAALRDNGVGVSMREAGGTKIDGLLRQLLSQFQPIRPELGVGPEIPPGMGPGPVVHRSPMMPGIEGPGPEIRHGMGPGSIEHRSPMMPGVRGLGPEVPGGNQTSGKLLERTISVLNRELESGQLHGKKADLVRQLLPKLEEKLVSSAGSNGKSGDETKLLTELLRMFDGGGRQGSFDGTTRLNGTTEFKTSHKASDPSAGIGPGEIDAMIANADGEGPEVKFSDY